MLFQAKDLKDYKYHKTDGVNIVLHKITENENLTEGMRIPLWYFNIPEVAEMIEVPLSIPEMPEAISILEGFMIVANKYDEDDDGVNFDGTRKTAIQRFNSFILSIDSIAVDYERLGYIPFETNDLAKMVTWIKKDALNKITCEKIDNDYSALQLEGVNFSLPAANREILVFADTNGLKNLAYKVMHSIL